MLLKINNISIKFHVIPTGIIINIIPFWAFSETTFIDRQRTERNKSCVKPVTGLIP